MPFSLLLTKTLLTSKKDHDKKKFLPSENPFYVDFRKQEPVSNFRLNVFLYRGGLNGKF